jgi:hypothetical protein
MLSDTPGAKPPSSRGAASEGEGESSSEGGDSSSSDAEFAEALAGVGHDSRPKSSIAGGNYKRTYTDRRFGRPERGSASATAAADGDASGAATVRQKHKITVQCWYIDPVCAAPPPLPHTFWSHSPPPPPPPCSQRYFVDVVRYRLYLMRRHIELLESSHGGENLFRCSNRLCTYECTPLEAQQRHTAQLAVAAAKKMRAAELRCVCG